MTQARRLRVLMVAPHPVQYQAPMFRRFANDARLEILVAYCTMLGAQSSFDPDFGVQVKWDVPLLEGYQWVHLPNRWSSDSGLFNPGIWKLIRFGKFDAVLLFTGYLCATFWIALTAAKMSGTAVLFGTDACELASRDGSWWKLVMKRRLWGRLFRLADVAFVVSSGGVALLRTLGIPDDRIVLTPYCVDNEWWIRQSERVDSAAVRTRWNIPLDATTILFCAKLQEWKRPRDLLRAFAQLGPLDCYVVFAGDGSLRSSLESEARSLGIAERVRFLGFVNQSSLPDVYSSCDLLVLPSAYEPFGVVVNEAMLCRCPVVVSDRVGARFDLVLNGKTGFVFPAQDVNALSRLLGKIVRSPGQLKAMGDAARERMTVWSPDTLVEATVDAIEHAASFRSKPRDC